MSESVAVTIDFAAREARAKQLAKLGDFVTAGMLMQDIEVMRELAAKLAPPAEAPSEAPAAETQPEAT